jgi:hypothetical protein
MPGYFGAGGVSCSACPHGKVTTTYNAAICNTCANGRYATSTSTECTDCVAGQFHASTGAACSNCVTGQYQTQNAGESCVNCDSGTYGKTEIAVSLAEHCVDCPAGEYQTTEGRVQCEQCPEGTFSNSPKLTVVCGGCVTGQYQPIKGQTSCAHCAVGRMGATGQTGADADTHCIGCTGGTYQPVPASTSCISCAIGRFSTALLRDSVCENCPSGKFQETIGSETCTHCGQGNHGTAGEEGASSMSAHCTACVRGRYQIGTNATECEPCAQGTFSEQLGRFTTCDHCPSGKYQINEASVDCTHCVAGKYGDSNADKAFAESHCTHCEKGQFQIASGNTTCVDCAPDSYTPLHGSRTDLKINSECILCSVQNVDSVRTYWQPVAGQDHCVKKPVACRRGLADTTFSTCTKSCRTKIYNEATYELHNGAAATTTAAAAAQYEAASLWGNQFKYQVPLYDSWVDDSGNKVGHWGAAQSCVQLADTYSRDDGRNSDSWDATGFRWKITQECNMHECPVDCVVSEWGEFGACSHSCTITGAAPGLKHRYRAMTRNVYHGGKICPTLHDPVDCNQHPCPIDCVVTEWTKYDACTKTCNGGTRSRTRTITTPVEFGGKVCPSLGQNEVCGAEKCGLDCKVETALNLFTEIPNGWKGAGAMGNYCNQCQCNWGEYTCTKRHCGPEYTQTCKKMTCEFKYNVALKEPVMVVEHHHHDYNTNHKCGYNLHEDTCVCHCAA